jgi:hypothetical protein
MICRYSLEQNAFKRGGDAVFIRPNGDEAQATQECAINHHKYLIVIHSTRNKRGNLLVATIVKKPKCQENFFYNY